MENDKQQIEEMAEEIEHAESRVETWHCRDVSCEKCEYKNCKYSAIAEELYEQDYRKIPKDSVVLSREEYENIYEQAEQNVFANIANGGTSCHWCIEQHERKVRKETAEKIITFLDDYCDCDSAYLVEQLKEYLAKQDDVGK